MKSIASFVLVAGIFALGTIGCNKKAEEVPAEPVVAEQAVQVSTEAVATPAVEATPAAEQSKK